MIVDNKTNFLFLADTLKKKLPDFYAKLETILRDNKIEFELLPGTNDIWAVDYMPIQVSKDRFVQFKYNPDYLRTSQKWKKTISDVDAICDKIGLKREHSNIVLDGGNVVKGENTVIVCDKIFRENPNFQRHNLIGKLKDLFEVDQIVSVPQDPEDFTGHADGMVRFVNEKTVLINNYRSNYQTQFQKELIASLLEAGLNCHTMIYSPDGYAKDSAKGLYINYLEIGNTIIVPIFGVPDLSNPWYITGDCADDEMAVITLESLFENHNIQIINCEELALFGGLLNCISWKIWK